MSPPRRKIGGGKDSAGAGRCPICGRPRDEKFRPFCSKRCADIDLARWLEGRYTIPGTETGDDESDSPAKQREEDKE